MEVTEFEEGHHCFGDFLTINGKDYEYFNEEEVIGFITEQLKNGLNREYFKQKFLTELLIDMDFEIVWPRPETLLTISLKLFVMPLQITFPAFNASLNRVLDASFKIPAMLEMKL